MRGKEVKQRVERYDLADIEIRDHADGSIRRASRAKITLTFLDEVVVACLQIDPDQPPDDD
jgi:hypothetical protein